MAETVTPRQAVYAHLRADPVITNLVGSRIYHQRVPPDATYPCIVINTIDNVDTEDLDAVAYIETRLQITVISSILVEAETIALAVRKSLEGFIGLMAGVLPVLGCRLDSYDPMPQEEIDQTHYRLDFIITHDEEG